MTETELQAVSAKLTEYDFHVLVDISGSMMEPAKASNPSGPTRWDYVQETVMGLVRQIDKLDADGIDLILFRGNDASGVTFHKGVNATKLSEIFRNTNPGSRTPTAEALIEAFKHADGGKKDFFLVVTDGEPNDKGAVARAIIEQSQKQETDDACTILFLQAGDDRAATAWLQQLDDNLTGAKFDIVDVKTVEEADKYNSAVELIAAAIAD